MFTSILGHGNRITKAARMLRTQLGVEDLEGRVVPSTMMAELNQAGAVGIGGRYIGEEIPTATSQQATVSGRDAGVYGRGSTEEIPQMSNRASAVVFGAIHDIGEEIPSFTGRQAAISNFHIGEEIPQGASRAAATAVVFGAIHDIGEEIPSLTGGQAAISAVVGEEIPS